MRAMEIREWVPGGDVTAVTEMLHRAYAELAEKGLRYLATHQDDEITRRRLEKDISWLAIEDGVVVGTIALCPWTSLTDPAPDYRRLGLWLFHQFGVDPEFQGRGIGRSLFTVAEERARAEGATELACDTSEGAPHLISLYERWGFEVIGRADNECTNYESVILAKSL